MYKYPGSKHNRRLELAEHMERLGPTSEYREPFLGGASVAFAFLARNPQVNTVWLNDIRPELIALWRAVRDYPDEFGVRLGRYPRHMPTLQEEFYDVAVDVRATTVVPTDKDDLLELAVGTQLVQQMSFNGIAVVVPTSLAAYLRRLPVRPPTLPLGKDRGGNGAILQPSRSLPVSDGI